jgi:hypothetical protein
MTFKCNKRRAISDVVATVLIIAVVLIASLAVGGFVFGIFGQAQNTATVAVTATALPAAYFKATGTTTTFTCSASPSVAYLTLTNTGTGSTSLVSIIITWSGTNSAFAASGSCLLGAAGSGTATTYLIFPATTKLSAAGAVNAAAGQSYTGTVTLSNGAQLLLAGTWQ